MSESVVRPIVKITPRHYQAVCSLALAAIVLLQLQQSTLATHIALVVSVLIGFLGWRAIFYRGRLSPMLVLLAIAVPHIVEQYTANQSMAPDLQGSRLLDLADVLLCMAGLTYFLGHYRLHGLWHGVLPPDARTPAVGANEKPRPPSVRSEESLSMAEAAPLVFTVPGFALVAQMGFYFVHQPWGLFDLSPRWRPILTFAWMLLLAMFLAAHAFRYWRRLQMDRFSAMLMLQDMLWHETRGEQRRVNRWIVWKKLRGKK